MPLTDGWLSIESAPRNCRFIGRISYADRYTGKLRYHKRITWYGKASHIPQYGWCHGRIEDVDLWNPECWKPLPGRPHAIS